MLIVTALIWGFAFSAQSRAAEYLDAISFNGLRFLLAAATIGVILGVYEFVAFKTGKPRAKWNKSTVMGGLLCGAILFVANNLQQLGIESTTVGKASFITSLYIVIVPVLGILRGKRTRANVWIAVIIAVAGFYTMCISENFSLSLGDLLVLLCAFMFSFQISFLDIFIEGNSPVRFTFMQFVGAAALSVPAMAINGFPAAQNINACILPMLYVGVMSAGVAFLLQTAGQKLTPPTTATLLMSLESVFGLLGGMMILGERPTASELAGCAVIFIAVFIAVCEPHRVFIENPYERAFRKNYRRKTVRF